MGLAAQKDSDDASTTAVGVDRNPNFIPNHIYKASILGMLGDEDKAKQAKVTLQNVNPNYKSSAPYVFFTDKRLSEIMLEGAHRAGLNIIDD